MLDHDTSGIGSSKANHLRSRFAPGWTYAVYFRRVLAPKRAGESLSSGATPINWRMKRLREVDATNTTIAPFGPRCPVVKPDPPPEERIKQEVSLSRCLLRIKGGLLLHSRQIRKRRHARTSFPRGCDSFREAPRMKYGIDVLVVFSFLFSWLCFSSWE